MLTVSGDEPREVRLHDKIGFNYGGLLMTGRVTDIRHGRFRVRYRVVYGGAWVKWVSDRKVVCLVKEPA